MARNAFLWLKTATGIPGATQSVNWNGTEFRDRSVVYHIGAFEGRKAIGVLRALPACFHPCRSEAETRALSRARRVHRTVQTRLHGYY